MIEEGLGDVEWSTLKIPAFKIKYRVVEGEKVYVCYRVKESEQFPLENPQLTDKEDLRIVEAFARARESEEPREYY
jgi:hypothetical protein